MTTLIEDNAGQLYIVCGQEVWAGRETCEPGTALRDLLLVEAGEELLGNLPMWRDGEYYPNGRETHPDAVVAGAPPDEVVYCDDEQVSAEVDRDLVLYVYVRDAGNAARRYLGIEEVPR